MKSEVKRTPGVSLDRVPPQDIDAERAVLGAILVSGTLGGPSDTLAIASSKLMDGEAFYKESHQLIFRAMLDVYERGDPVDLITVMDELERKAYLERVGGVPYLDEMQDACPSAANVGYYADIVLERHARRRLIYASAQTYSESFDETEEPEQIMSRLEETMIQIRQKRGLDQLKPVKDVIKPVFDQIQEAYHTKELVTGLATGLKELDQLIAGFHRGEFIIIGGRPGVGKSTVARNIACFVAMELEIPVLMFSIEATENVVVARMLASEASLLYQDMRTGNIKEVAWPRLTISAGKILDAPIFIDDDCSITPAGIRAKCQMFMAKREAGLVIVDHLHEVVPDRPSDRRESEVRAISKSLKVLARSLNIPVIALCQLSRAPENRPDKRPVLSDLRQSGSLEQQADVVIFLYRKDYHEWKATDHSAELIVAKQRNGPRGTIRVVYDEQNDRYRQFHPGEDTRDHEVERYPGEEEEDAE